MSLWDNVTNHYGVPASATPSARPTASALPVSQGSSTSPNYLGLARQGVSTANNWTKGGNSALGALGAGLNVYSGIKQGSPLGYASAAINAGRLANQIGGSGTVPGVGVAGDALGIYSGLTKGGVGGYGTAALDAYNLYNTLSTAGSAAAGAGSAAAGAGSGAGGAAAGAGAGAAAAGLGAVGGILLSAYLDSQMPAVIDPTYYQNLSKTLSKGPGVGGNPNVSGDSPEGQQYGQYMGMRLGAATHGDPIAQSILKAYGQDPTVPVATKDYQPWQLAQMFGTAPKVGTRKSMRAKGGSMKKTSIKSKLHELYAGSFAGRKRNYDDGGYVNYPNYVTPVDSGAGSPWSFDDTAPSDPYYTMPVDSGQGSPSSSEWGFSDPSSGATDAAYQAYVSAGGDPNAWGGAPSAGSNEGSPSGGGGALSGLGNLLGVSSVGQFIQKYGALAPLIAGALGGNKPASAPGTPAGYGAIQPMPTPSNPRSYTQPNVANWYTYGEGPEQNFFSNNQLPNVPGVSPSQTAAPPSQGTPQPALSAPTSAPVAYAPHDPQTYIMGEGTGRRPHYDAGGSTFNSTRGDAYVSDPGHGDGTSDDIDAKLSGGEYVMDAGTVSMLGNGSNEAGSRALDQLRQRIRKHAGKHLVKGKQFMKAKPPEAYLRGGK